MKKINLIGVAMLLLSIFFLVYGCGKADESALPQEGSSITKAIIISYTGEYYDSIGQEYKYLENRFGARGKDWVLIEQKLHEENDKFYDILTIETVSGEKVIMHFDITEPFLELQKQFGEER